MEIQCDYPGSETISSIYFGGGTPSLLREEQINGLLEKAFSLFKVEEKAEITLEANPDDLSREYLDGLKRCGINRLSIGMQTFHEPHLRTLNRIHSATEAINAYMTACDAGFSNITLDLIYGIPAENHDIWHRDLDRLFQMRPAHFSAYCLTIEPRTVLGNWTRHHKFHPADDEFAAQQYEILMECSEQEGYEAYEISNFALGKQYSRHNSAYWFHEPYLGLGPGAHSFRNNTRQSNISNNYNYMKSIEAGIVPCTSEALDQRDLANEYLMTSLRTARGCDLGRLKERYGYHPPGKRIERGIQEGHLLLERGMLRLSRRGRLLADSITADLFWV
jgi:oxygen-independent coproporphyrinogen-3 oxidase